MTTTTSYSNAGHFRPLYGSLLKRNAGYFGMISVLIFLFYPVQFALEIFKTFHDYQLEEIATAQSMGEPLINVYNLIGYGKNYTAVSTFFFSVIMIVMPIVLALMLNSYMHSKKAADVFHSLPIRRETMLLANAAVGMTMLAVPVVLSNIAIVAMMTAKFGWLPQLVGSQLMDMLGWLSCALAIYAVTTLASVLSGTVFDSMIFSSMMLFSLPTVGGIYLVLCSVFLHGFSVNNETMANLLLCSPTFIMVSRMVNAEGETFISQARDLFANNMAIVVYLVLGVLLLCLAARIYRNRRSEIAETTGYVGPLPLATKLVGTLICGIVIGMMFYAMNDNNKLIYILWAIIGSMMAYVILEVILSRGFKHLIKSLPIGAAMIAFTVIASSAIMNGGFGYENRVPKMENVASISIQGLNSINNSEDRFYNAQTKEWDWYNAVTLSDPQNLQTILDFHADTVTRNMPKNRSALIDAGEQEVYQSVTLTYQMKNGTKMMRSYRNFSNKTLEKLNMLQFSSEFLTQKDQAFTTPVANITEWKVSNSFGSEMERPTLTLEESTRLLEAMQADVLARTPETLTAQPVAWVSWTTEYAWGREPKGFRSADNHFNVLATDLKTLDFLRQKTLLDAIEPDWSKCTAVSLSLKGRYSNTLESGMFQRVSPDNVVLSQERESIENAMRYYEEEMAQETITTETIENGILQAKFYGETFLLETLEEVAAVKNSVIGIGRKDQQLLQALFFFETSDKGLAVFVDYDSLPESIKAKCHAMWGENFSFM